MKNISIIVFFMMACSEKSNSDIAQKVYQNIHQSPVLELCKEVSVSPRGNINYVFLHTNTASVERDGKIVWSHHQLSPIEENRAKILVNFMVKNGIKKIDGNYSKSRELEIRINEKLVLIKNPSQEYKDSSLKNNFHTPLQKLGDDWYFYEDKKDYDFGG
jgi:hypothetical protein